MADTKCTPNYEMTLLSIACFDIKDVVSFANQGCELLLQSKWQFWVLDNDHDVVLGAWCEESDY